jgi:hypothetical protein
VSDGDVQCQHLVDVWEMHLQAVFCFVDVLAHGLEAPFALELMDKGSVDGQVAQRGGVLVAAGCCSAGEVVMVRWAEQEDALAVSDVSKICTQCTRREQKDRRIRPVSALVGPCSSRPGIGVTSVPAYP